MGTAAASGTLVSVKHVAQNTAAMQRTSHNSNFATQQQSQLQPQHQIQMQSSSMSQPLMPTQPPAGSLLSSTGSSHPAIGIPAPPPGPPPSFHHLPTGGSTGTVPPGGPPSVGPNYHHHHHHHHQAAAMLTLAVSNPSAGISHQHHHQQNINLNVNHHVISAPIVVDFSNMTVNCVQIGQESQNHPVPPPPHLGTSHGSGAAIGPSSGIPSGSAGRLK